MTSNSDINVKVSWLPMNKSKLRQDSKDNELFRRIRRSGPYIMASNVQQQSQHWQQQRRRVSHQCVRQRHQQQQQQSSLPLQQQKHPHHAHNATARRPQQLPQLLPQRYYAISKGVCARRRHRYPAGNVVDDVLASPANQSTKLIGGRGRRAWSLLLRMSLSLMVLMSLGSPAWVAAEGNVGCQFVRTLCVEGSEVCFNDNIFGKCIPTTGVDVEEIEKRPLTEEQSRTLSTMLEELQGAGLGWDHPFVQCRIQGTLFSLQRQTHLPPNLCANLAPQPTEIDPAGAMAYVRFKPPDYDEDYAEQSLLYYPPPKKLNNDDGISTILQQLQWQDRQQRHELGEMEHFGKLDAPEKPSVMDAFLNAERTRLQQEQLQREAEAEAAQKEAMRSRLELYQILAASEPDPQPYQRKPVASSPTAMEQLERVVEREQQRPRAYMAPNLEENDSNELYFLENYGSHKRTVSSGRKAHPRFEEEPTAVHHSFFRELAAAEGEPARPQYVDAVQNLVADKRMPQFPYKSFEEDVEQPDDLAALDEEEREQRIFEQGLLRNSLTPFEEAAMLQSNSYPSGKQKTHKPEKIFSEGGLIYLPEGSQAASEPDSKEKKKEKARELLANMFGFTRHERLDVKKPGPLVGPPPNALPEEAQKNANPNPKAETKEVLPPHIKDSTQAHKKKNIIKNHSDEDHAPHTVDATYAHVYVKNPIDSWSDGVRIVNELANILHMQGYFTYLTVQTHEVSFRVDSNNPERKTATDIARAINENRGVKNNLLRRLGVTVVYAGVGDKVKRDEDYSVSSARIELAEQGPDVTHILAYMFAGAGAAAVIVIFVTLILIKRHDKKRDKLGGLQSGSSVTGAESCSKDYQDLCRARMAGKGNTGEPTAANIGRITSLTKENDRPPSSRSSTSSWSEEPALTNMDISTGHMVLSYMEDHLRNKGRLQREWEALTRYVAEPGAREAAQNPQCVNFNRTGAPLPFDHSRVVLNHLANEEGLDYVNASTITDHDPRAPAYVAAQGPLPTTLAHFWQMIWEQGAVVIVALCRLQENGEIACARYWPEEGAEVYHIYEVHLVSEHIWCDDYLVRSFYLKNLRTGETRTVTQFHFLSWPQNGVPAQAKALLDFRRKVNKSYRGRSCPIVVHGSTGAGRTGAYILLDLVLGRMNKGAREIDIAATLEHLRDQRAGLVATRQQFEFVLMAVAEEVHAILKALPANQSGEKRDLEAKENILKEEEAVTQEKAAKAAQTPAKEKEKDSAPSTSAATDKKKPEPSTSTNTAVTPAKTAAGGGKKK